MAGSIIPKGKGKHLVRVFIGRDPNGKRRYRAELVRGGKRKAEERLAELVTAKGAGRLAPRPKLTVAEWLDTWAETVAAPSVRARTLSDYRRAAENYIKPHVGGFRLDRLAPADVRHMLATLSEAGYAPRTVRLAHEVLRNALEAAVADRLIRENPARGRLVKKALPRKERKERATVSPDDVQAFLDVARGERLGPFFILQLFSGLRPSEALALRWSDVNVDTVSITRVLVDRIGPLVFEAPKSATSRRVVIVPDVVVDVLREHRKQQVEERLAAGPEWQDGDLIFCTPTGAPLRQYQLRPAWKGLKKAAGLPDRLRLYDLRHSAATLLLERGVPLKVVSEMLGHSSITLTADTYSHVTESMQRQAADVLGALAK